jgi:putative SOS response-associated peptidase YedK
MCNLYRMTKATDEVARLFTATVGNVGNAGGEVYPGYPGLVVAGGQLRSMVWGFPLVLKGKSGQPLKPKPVNNARADKLDGFMWRYSFAERRCLIPVSAFAEAEGEKGAKTRTWFTLPDQEVFAVAGIWRDTPEWGPAYTMVMTEACIHVADVHDRMPVILRPDDWTDWLDGPPDAAGLLCRPYPDLMVVNRTTDPWVRRSAASEVAS